METGFLAELFDYSFVSSYMKGTILTKTFTINYRPRLGFLYKTQKLQT